MKPQRAQKNTLCAPKGSIYKISIGKIVIYDMEKHRDLILALLAIFLFI
jgi:hypothetical protein